MNLYFIADNSDPLSNKDLFVWAPTAEEAEERWRYYFGINYGQPELVFVVPTEKPDDTKTLYWRDDIALVKDYK